MTAPGWFPDPERTPGRWRWWDGARWTGETRSGHPPDPPPGPGRGTPTNPSPRPSRARLAGVLVIVGLAVAALVAVVTVAPEVVRRLGAGPGPPTTEVCPISSAPTTPPTPSGDRLSSDRVSVPRLGAPWGAPMASLEVPYGRGFVRQEIPVDDDPPWVTSVSVGTVVAGDGFAGPQDGVHRIIECLLASYYLDVGYTPETLVDQAITVDQRPGWQLETRLRFTVPGLDFDTERLLLVLIDLGDGTCAAFISDIPQSAIGYEPDIRRALRDLRID